METSKVMQDLVAFRDSRDWGKFHTMISLARALSIEASEVEKVFQWKASDGDLTDEDRQALKMEVADVLTYAYYLCDRLNVDPDEIVEAKLNVNQKRHWKFEA
ncbi:nucleotide pyrophosphohydrolase [Lacticaseibacillus suihuaensis]